jgi:hypothetical protein
VSADPEAAALSDVLEHIGKSDLRSTYWDEGYHRSDPKQQERERVLEFILDASRQLPEHYPIRLLSMPGLSWNFERMLLAEKEGSHLVALEKSNTIYKRARAFMPFIPSLEFGRYTKLTKQSSRYWIGSDYNYLLNDRELTYGSGQIIYTRGRASRHLGNCTDRSHRFLLMDTATYASMLATDYGATLQEKQGFNIRFNLRNAVWLDYTSPLCHSVEETLKNLLFCLEPSGYKKPIIVTVLNARDGFHGDEQRVGRLLKLQPALEYVKHWTYTGKGGVSMLTACFVAQ